MKIAVFCVGNKLLLDEGIGPAVYDELVASYEFPDNVDLFDVGCMGLEMIGYVDDYDYLITIDAVDGTDEAPGTVFEFSPDDMARRDRGMASLHELKLSDLFDAAFLMGYEAQGKCFGMQVQNMTPEMVTIGLTQPVYEALPLLIDALLADLHANGVEVVVKATGEPVRPGHHHVMSE
ncbi:MAG: hydrogenase maturation protease [Eggerthellaceae bacterium]|nr:hydrogenase maturation protease [Eggerthellaceae bacterium]